MCIYIYIYIYIDTFAKQMNPVVNCMPEAYCLSVQILYGYSFYLITPIYMYT